MTQMKPPWSQWFVCVVHCCTHVAEIPRKHKCQTARSAWDGLKLRLHVTGKEDFYGQLGNCLPHVWGPGWNENPRVPVQPWSRRKAESWAKWVTWGAPYPYSKVKLECKFYEELLLPQSRIATKYPNGI